MTAGVLRPRVAWRLSHRALAAVLVLSAAATLAGCTSARNVLGPSASPCFRALPAAASAVGARAHFAGVRDGRLRDLLVVVQRRRAGAAPVSPPDALEDSSSTQVCLVAYRPPISADAASARWKPWPGRIRFAVVVVGEQNLRVVATILLDRAPLRFARDFPVVR